MKTIHSNKNKILLEWLTNKRMLQGKTQQQLSELLGKPQSFVSKYENGERRIDLIETLDICEALDVNPIELIKLLIKGYT